MKKLYRRLALTLLLSAVLLVLVFTVSMYERGSTESNHYLNQLLDSVELNLEQAQEDEQIRLELLKEDYLNRAWAVEYVLSGGERTLSEAELVILKDLMEVHSITLLDHAGQVFMSTNEEMGKTYECTQEVMEVLTSSDESAYCVYIDPADFAHSPERFYVTVKAQAEAFGAVRIDPEMSGLGLKSRMNLVERTLRQATTEYGTSILAVRKHTGEIVGITNNNHQEFSVEGMETTEELLNFLQSAGSEKHMFLTINGQFRNAVIREHENMYLIAYTSLDTVVRNMIWSFAEGVLGIGVVSLFTILLVRFHLKKYFFAYFTQVEESISRILDGHRTPVINDNEIPEIRPLVETILELEKNYIDKSEGIIRMEDQLSLAQAEAKYDKLTGLYNRSGFEEQVEEFLKNGDCTGTFILFDLDNFKRVNDMEGHPEGDRILERFAQYLGTVLRKGDSIGRLGGDEFVALIPNDMPVEILRQKFDMLLSGVREVFGSYYERYDTSVSIGAVPVDGTIRTYKGLYKCADTALYIAKHLGKNCYYINEKKIFCMKRECIRCRVDCPRSRILNLPEKNLRQEKGKTEK